MSTKIYNGGRLPLTSLEVLLCWCREARKVLVEARAEQLRSRYTLKQYRKERDELQKRAWRIETTCLRDPAADFSFNATFFPLREATLVIPFQDNPGMLKAWNRLPYLIEYGYWNNTDIPAECTDTEWSQRKDDWDLALPGSGVPQDHGFDFIFTDYTLPFGGQLW